MLDGEKLMPLSIRYNAEALNSTWKINVGGRLYGPYTGHQIKSFAREGRVAPHSIVQAGEAGPWITAIDDPILGQLFVVEGQRKTSTHVAAAGVGAPAVAPERTQATSSAPESNFVIIADLRGTGTGQVQSAITKMGENYRLTPASWVLRSSKPVGTIRNELTVVLGRQDSIFVVDTLHNKTAWFNLGPDADAHIRKVWNRDGERIS
ncbi:MAG: hypothetical protein ABL973_06800 [Micropepsaceae bacterium]